MVASLFVVSLFFALMAALAYGVSRLGRPGRRTLPRWYYRLAFSRPDDIVIRTRNVSAAVMSAVISVWLACFAVVYGILSLLGAWELLEEVVGGIFVAVLLLASLGVCWWYMKYLRPLEK